MSGPPCRRCTHPRDGHHPYVPGGDKPGFCEECLCWQFRPERPWTRLLAFLRERPPPVTADVLRQHPVPYPVPDRGEDGWDDDRTQFGIRVAPYAGPPRTRRERR